MKMYKFIIIVFGMVALAGCSQNVSDTGPTQVSPTTDTSPIANATVRQMALPITLQAGNQAQLQWSASNPEPAYYDLLVTGDNGYSNNIRLDGTTLSYLDTNLTANVTYQYQLNAYDQQDNLITTYQSTARINVYSTVASDTVL